MLTDLEKVKIETFCADKDMYNAVRKVILASIYTHGVNVEGQAPDPLKNGAYSLVALSPSNPIPDEIIGQQLRAQWAGVNAMKNAFDELDGVRSLKAEKKEKEVNPAE